MSPAGGDAAGRDAENGSGVVRERIGKTEHAPAAHRFTDDDLELVYFEAGHVADIDIAARFP